MNSPLDSSRLDPTLAASQLWNSTIIGTRLMQLAVVLAALAALSLLVDMQVARYWHQVKLGGDVRNFFRMIEAFAYGYTVLILIFMVSAIDPRGARILPRLLLCTYGPGVLVNIVKVSVSRMRPSSIDDLNVSVMSTFGALFPFLVDGTSLDHRMQSFPSGHTATATGFAAALAILYPQRAWVFVILPVVAALQRLQSESHFLSDTLSAASLACFAVALSCLVPLVSRRLLKFEAPSSIAEQVISSKV
ncbi:phosphoesterase PA-phosphatase related protein [Pirellula staleyi DSM 6068]|uniref:Phosphoesterase PA-phosphatase related protein n=1 Tax=Pirellula staleyi (strain ATCC 27377 / DSM 6068 / ICPB 4128) TaxID=530564 RepID=D2R8R7_PIRSD|nr:phosphatase PAP2 family protein [Pirellula staleyi]ADB17608.1 phosphoesterase PA-phosphatase related protein [Pirellula staleyi DSM 6068]